MSGAMARERGSDLGGRGNVEIQIAARAAARRREPQRIDVVGTLLERLRGEAAPRERCRQPDAQRGLAGGLVGGGDEESVHDSGSNGSTLTPTATSAAASATPPSARNNSGTLGAYAWISPSKKRLDSCQPGKIGCGQACAPMIV